MLFSCVPAEGHFRPMLPLARALAAAGHEVVFATSADWEPHVAAEGFTTLPAGISNAEATLRMGREGRELTNVTPLQRRAIVFPRRFAGAHASAKASELLEIASSWGPDAIVYESADLASPMVGAVFGTPAVNHSFGSLVPLSVLEISGMWSRRCGGPTASGRAVRRLVHRSVRRHLPACPGPGRAAGRANPRTAVRSGARVSSRVVRAARAAARLRDARDDLQRPRALPPPARRSGRARRARGGARDGRASG